MPVFAAIDIGSNSVRLSIAEWKRNRLHVLHQDREVTRLGEGVFRTGTLDPRAMAHTIKVLQRFHKAVQKHAADRIRIVATSAMRDADNARVFQEWVKNVTGWRPEVITGLEEGRLIHLGVVSNQRSPAKLLLFDLGGGSCEITLSHRRHIQQMVSLPLGAVRLTQEFLKHDPPRPEELNRMCEFIREELRGLPRAMRQSKVNKVLATSGTAAALAGAVHSGKRAASDRVSRRAVEKLTAELAQLDCAERAAIKGINNKRAEIVIAGASVFRELLETLDLSGFQYSPLGLRDGLLAQMAAEFDEHAKPHRQLEADRWDALLATSRWYKVDVENAVHTRTLSLKLFDSLRSIHGLPAAFREWIGAAAVLQETGSYINPVGRNRHAHYIIANSELFGYSPQQRRIIAAIARFQGKSKPSSEDRLIKALPPSVRSGTIKAVVLLRLARALNQGRQRSVRSLRSTVSQSKVTLRLQVGRGGADLELWAAEKEISYFREVFGRELFFKTG